MYELKLYGFHLGEFECHSCVDLATVNKAFYHFVNLYGLHHFELNKVGGR